LGWEVRRRMVAGKKRAKTKGCWMNSIVAGIDLGERESLATLLSTVGDVADRFSFPMSEDGYAFFASRVPKDVKRALIRDCGKDEARCAATSIKRSIG
jgi:hypothetical protein